MEYDESSRDALLRRAEKVASLVRQIRDDRWVTDLISTMRRPGWPASSELLMLELTLADAERSAQKLLDLRGHLVQEVGALQSH